MSSTGGILRQELGILLHLDVPEGRVRPAKRFAQPGVSPKTCMSSATLTDYPPSAMGTPVLSCSVAPLKYFTQ